MYIRIIHLYFSVKSLIIHNNYTENLKLTFVLSHSPNLFVFKDFNNLRLMKKLFLNTKYPESKGKPSYIR